MHNMYQSYLTPTAVNCTITYNDTAMMTGAYFGYKKDPLEFPVVTSNIPRQIPEQPW